MSPLKRIQEFYNWKHIRILLVVNTIIAIFIGFLNIKSITNFTIFIYLALYFLLIVQCIGFSISTILNLLNVDRIGVKSLKWFLVFISIVLAGWIGLIIGGTIGGLLPEINFSLDLSVGEIIGTSSQFAFFGILAYGYFILRDKLKSTAARLAEKEVQEQRLLQLKTQAELNALRAKINPHFLFNTLNSIASLIPVDPKRAEDMVQKLSHLFRSILEVDYRTYNKLSEEFDTVKKYLEIENVRLGKRLTYRIQLDDSLKLVLIPALLLQPIVENGIKHGIAPKQEGGEIIVQAQEQKDRCVIEISDTGFGFPDKKPHEGFGLRSVRERLELSYPNDFTFNITYQNGTNVIISIPILTEESSHAKISNPADR